MAASFVSMVAGIFLSGKGEVCVWFTLNQNQNQTKQNQNKTLSPMIPLCLESTEKIKYLLVWGFDS